MPWGVPIRNLLPRGPGLLVPGRTGLPGEEEGSAERAQAPLSLGSGRKFLVELVSGRDRTVEGLAELEWEPSLLLSCDLFPPLG